METFDSRIRLDARTLRGIAHPVRMRMLAVLRSGGPATASGLARRLGLNTGATSYHLRQLAEHGFIVEVPDRGVRRERWWQAAHQDTEFPAAELIAEDADAAEVFMQVVARTAADAILRSVDARSGLSVAWQDAQDVSDYRLTLTAAQARELAGEVHEVVRRHRAALIDQPATEQGEPMRVAVQFQLLPLEPLVEAGAER